MPRGILTILLLVCSNAFMTLAWYGHIVFKSKLERVSLAAIVLLSWGVALFEYCFQVPANRIGSVEYGGAVHAVATESDSGGNYAYRLLLFRVVFQQERIASMESHRRVLLSGTGRLFYFQAVDGRRNDQKGPDVRSGLFAVRLPDEIRPDRLLRFRKRYLARLDIFQQPRHVVAQRAHGLHTFGILRRFAGQPAVYAVPVLRRYDGHVVDSEILVQPVERRARTAAPADGYGCCRLEAEQLPCRVEEPVQNRAQGTVRAGVVGR